MRGPDKKKRKRRKWVGQKGGHRPNVKLTADQVKEIWYLLHEKHMTQLEIAKLYGVVQETISHIATGTRWNKVTGLPRRTKTTLEPPRSGAVVGRPRTVALKAVKPLRKANYAKLVDRCVVAILKGDKHVHFRVVRLMKFPEGFPYREDVSLDYGNRTVKVAAKAMLAWLHKNNHTEFSVEYVVSLSKQFGLAFLLGDDKISLQMFKDIINDN